MKTLNPTARFEVRVLRDRTGYVIVDTLFEHPMIGPYSDKEVALARAAEFERDPRKVPTEPVAE